MKLQIMGKLLKNINLITLIVFVCSNNLFSFSYVGAQDFDISENNSEYSQDNGTLNMDNSAVNENNYDNENNNIDDENNDDSGIENNSDSGVENNYGDDNNNSNSDDNNENVDDKNEVIDQEYFMEELGLGGSTSGENNDGQSSYEDLENNNIEYNSYVIGLSGGDISVEDSESEEVGNDSLVNTGLLGELLDIDKEIQIVLSSIQPQGEEITVQLSGDDTTINNNFKYRTITIGDYTIMDRNLGASEPWDGVTMLTDNSDAPYYGYYYQRGNNYGFTSNTSNGQYGPAVVNENQMPSKFFSNVWMSRVPWDNGNADNNYNYNLRGEVSDTEIARKGPCPEGWHVPTYIEWQRIYNTWSGLPVSEKSTSETTTTKNFVKDLLLPFAGYRSYYQSFYRSTTGYYWTSTSNDSSEAGYFYFTPTTSTTRYAKRTYGFPVRCFKNFLAKVTFDPNLGAFSGMDKNETIDVLFSKNSAGKFKPDVDVGYPVRLSEGETGYMFDWRYLDPEGETRWTGSVSDNMTLYAKWLPFTDLILNYSGVEVRIMDRNLGATKTGTVCSSNNIGPCGYHYQWGNNYGFAFNGINSSLPNSEEVSWNSVSDWVGKISTYYNSTFIVPSPWNNGATVSDNLWGGLNYQDKDELKQGPCPIGYHIPNDKEWESLYNLWKSEDKTNNTYNNGNKFKNDLLLPFAGWRQASNRAVYSLNSLGGYRTSVPDSSSVSAAKAVLIQSNSINMYHKGGRSDPLSIRCFKNSIGEYLIKFETNSGVMLDDIMTNRWWENGTSLPTTTREGYQFGGWYTTSGFDLGTQVTMNSLVPSSGKDFIVLYAKWNDVPYITYDANGGYYNDGGDEQLVEYSKVGLNYVRSGNVEIPNKTGYMFAGWYTVPGNYSVQTQEWSESITSVYMEDPTTSKVAYAKWLSFQDLTIVAGREAFTLMDRNLGATSKSISNSSSYGFYFKWGNNHGFLGGGSDIAQASVGNWGLKDQGPCPKGYYVPSMNDVIGLTTAWSKAMGISILNPTYGKVFENNSYFEMLKNDYMVPMAGGTASSNGTLYGPNQYTSWLTSERSTDADKVKTLYFSQQYSNYFVEFAQTNQSSGYPVRCFKSDKQSYNVNLNGGTGGVIVLNGTTIATIRNPRRNNSHFDGWYSNSTFQGSSITVGSTITHDLYAKWSCDTGYGLNSDGTACIKKNKVTFNAASNGGVTQAGSFYAGNQTVNLSNYSAYKSGYDFIGWNKVQYATGKIDSYYVSSDITFYAIFKRTVRVSYSLGTGISMLGRQYDVCTMYNSSKTCKVSVPSFVLLDGYWTGYFVNEDKSDLVYSGGIIKLKGNRVYTVSADPINYTISYNFDGGYFSGDYQTGYNVETNSFSLPILSKYNCDFMGWTGSNLEKIELQPTVKKGTTGDLEYTAVWQCNPNYSGRGRADNLWGGGGGGGGGNSKTVVEVESHGSADDIDIGENKEKNKEMIESNNEENVLNINDDKIEIIEDVEKNIKIENDNLQNLEQYTQEQKDAYSFAKSNGITTTSSIEKAKMNTDLTRIEMAKMLSYYAINILGQEPNIENGEVRFNDVTKKMDKQYDDGVTLAYQLGIMGQNMPKNNFRPNDKVTRAEFVTALSRMLYKTPEGANKGTRKYYEPHMLKLYDEGIITNTNPKLNEKRGYVMLMLMRASDHLYNKYEVKGKK